MLLAARGAGSHAIALQLGEEENTVGKWRRRFAKLRVKGLRDDPRSGRPPKFTARQKARVLKRATEQPREHGVPFSHWDAASLARLAVDAGIPDSIHPTTVWRWLNDADLKPHRVRYWLKSGDPDFELTAAGRILARRVVPEASASGQQERAVKPLLERAKQRLEEVLGQQKLTKGLLVRVRGEQLTLVREEKGPDGAIHDDPRVRLTHLGDGCFGLSVLRHTGRWERTPFSGTVDEMLDVMLGTMQHLIADWP